ncbi:maestro heat-like repeat-containing protein family member 1 isoform X2 [Ciona intestinalis]
MSSPSRSSQAESLVGALVASSFDADPATRGAIFTSLSEFGGKSPNLVLKMVHEFLIKHPKLDLKHRVLLLSSVNKILILRMNDVDAGISEQLITLASEDLTKTKKLSHEWQREAGQILVNLSTRFLPQVLDELQKKYVPGILPHYYVVHTLGKMATSNVSGSIPHIGGLLSTTLPLLGLSKHDDMRLVFSFTISSFCEAIMEYTANPVEDMRFTKSDFSIEILGAFDVLFSVWINTRDSKVLFAVIGALGKMSHLLSPEALQTNSPRLVAVLLNLYKRHNSTPLPITTAICDVITAVTAIGSSVLEQNLDSLITNLHHQVCHAPENFNCSPEVVKNYNELLRCFGTLATCYSDILVGTILQKAESKEEKVRNGNLVILRHLINSNSSAMERKQDFVVTGLLKHLFETNNKVKQNLSKLIIAMATHGYLLREGGQEFIRFVTLQCSLPDEGKPPKPGMVTNSDLREMCGNILKLVTTTIDGMEGVLWPYLFEFLCKEQNTNSVGVLCRSLSFIAEKKRENNSDDFNINYSETVNIPSASSLFSRLLVFVSQPLVARCHSRSVLSLLLNFAPNIHDHLVDIWAAIIPKMIQFIDENEESEIWPQKAWEDVLLKFLSKSLDAIDDEHWTSLVGQSMTSQWPLYDREERLPYKNFSYKCLGIILRKSTNKEFVESYLATLFTTVQHCNQLEREGAGVCVGYCASSHLDLTLQKLLDFTKLNINKKDSSYLNLFKSDRSLTEVANMKGTVSLCFGYIALFAPTDLITSRIETIIVKTLTPLFKGLKIPAIKVDLVSAVDLIAQSVAPDRLALSENRSKYVFSAREDLLWKLMAYLREAGNKPSKLKSAIFEAAASLIKLEPPMRDEDIASLLTQCITHVIASPPDGATELLQANCSEKLVKLMKEILKKRKNSHGLFAIFKQLESFLISEKQHERQRAIEIIGFIFITYYNILTISESNSSLHHLGSLLGRLIPCCSDPDPDVRLEALLCVRIIIMIINKYNGMNDQSCRSSVEEIETLETKLTNPDTQIMYEGMTELAKMVCLKVPSDSTHFYPGSLTYVLFDAITWPQQTSANGACLVLHHIFETRGPVFVEKVDMIMSQLLPKLSTLPEDGHTRSGALQIVIHLSRHHLHQVIQSLLCHSPPFSNDVISCWTQLGGDQLRDSSIEYLLDQLERSLPYEEVGGKKRKTKQNLIKNPATHSLAISCALETVVASIPPVEKQPLEGIIYRCLGVSLLRLGVVLDVQKFEKSVDPYSQALELLKTVISTYLGRKVNLTLQQLDIWTLLGSKEGISQFTEAVSSLAMVICKHRPGDVASIVTILNPYLKSIYDMHRCTVAAFYAQLVKEFGCKDNVLLEIMMDNLRDKLVDPMPTVRQLCIRGLANVIFTSSEQIDRYSASVISALMAGMDDKDDYDDTISLEAMSGLAKFLSKVERTNIASVFVNMCLRVRPCFEKANPHVRSAAVRLFGVLGRFGTDGSADTFREQSHSNFISILLHLNDDHLVVRNVGEFPNKINFYIMSCVSFFKSEWPVLRGSAALLAAFFMNSLDEEARSSINIEHVCAALIQLLKDSSPEVRSKTSEAISLLHQY